METVAFDGEATMRAGVSKTTTHRAWIAAASLVALVTMVLPVQGASAEEKWQFIVEPYVFMGSLNGKSEIGRTEGDIDANFGDILKNLKIAAMLNAEATNGRWGVIADGQYMKLGLKKDLRGDRFAGFSSKMTIFETEAFHRWNLGERATLDAFAGIRYWNNRLYADISGTLINPRVRRAADWVDPLIGVRFAVPLMEKLSFNFRGDIGGFGAGSSFSWQVVAGFSYNVSNNIAMTLSYRYLDVDYSRGQPNTPERFVFDAAMHGPQLGFRFTF